MDAATHDLTPTARKDSDAGEALEELDMISCNAASTYIIEVDGPAGKATLELQAPNSPKADITYKNGGIVMTRKDCDVDGNLFVKDEVTTVRSQEPFGRNGATEVSFTILSITEHPATG